MKKIIFFVLAVLIITGPAIRSFGGELDDFETGKETKEDSRSKDSSVSDAVASGIIETLASIFIGSLFEMSQEKDLKGLHKYLRAEGSPLLPTFRVDANYQYLLGNMQSFDGRLEAGYLMFGVDGEFKRFWEKSPHDTLNMADFHFLLRALFAENFQINLAVGEKFLWGDKRNQGVDLGLPFYFSFGKYLMWDVRPYVAFVGDRQIYDIGSALNLKYKFAGIRAGYRVIGTGGRKLQGPEIGLFLQF